MAVSMSLRIMDNRELRIDKWLWAARFFKTRSLAADAVNGGKVEVNGVRAKPSRTIKAGDHLSVRRGLYEWTVTVKDIAKIRGPASKAALLYEETEDSVRRRQSTAARLELEHPPAFDAPGRPSKKDRRALERFRRRGR